AEDGIRDLIVTGVQTCALPIYQGCRVRARNLADAKRCAEAHRPGNQQSVAVDQRRRALACRNSREKRLPHQARTQSLLVISTRRSEERRVGKECRAEWAAEYLR